MPPLPTGRSAAARPPARPAAAASSHAARPGARRRRHLGHSLLLHARSGTLPWPPRRHGSGYPRSLSPSHDRAFLCSSGWMMDVYSNPNSCISKTLAEGFPAQMFRRITTPNCSPSGWRFALAALSDGRGTLEGIEDPTLPMLSSTTLGKVPLLPFWNANKPQTRPCSTPAPCLPKFCLSKVPRPPLPGPPAPSPLELCLTEPLSSPSWLKPA